MFIPNVHPKIVVGDSVLLRQDYNLDCGTFTRGHLFTVLELLTDGKVKVIDSNNYILTLEKSMVNKNITFYEAKEIDKNNKEYQRVKRVIIDKCTQKDYSYDEYERFDTCKLKDNNRIYDKTCQPSLECIKYCDEKTQNSLKVPLRSIKIKKLKKKESIKK